MPPGLLALARMCLGNGHDDPRPHMQSVWQGYGAVELFGGGPTLENKTLSRRDCSLV